MKILKERLWKKLHIESSDKGFSLVEVLIAMLIMAVVSVPILSCFVSATKYNGKAKTNQHITGAAQSIMEGFKANTMESLVKQFNGEETFRVYVSPSTSAVLPTYSYNGLINSPSTPHNSSAIDFTDEDNEFSFSLDGIEYEGDKFDADIFVKAHTYQTGAPVSESDATPKKFGNEEIDYIENMNGFNDALYTESTTAIQEGFYGALDKAITYLNTLSGSYHVNGAGIMVWEGNYNREKMLESSNRSMYTIKRETKVNIDGSGSQKVTVTVKYIINLNNFRYTGTDGSTHYTTKEYSFLYETKEVYNNASTGADLENVFLFLYPAYKSTTFSFPISEDKFEITNSLGGSNEINVYFVKQKNNTLSNLQVLEETYSPKITCANYVNFYHNLSVNLSGSGTVSAPTINLTNHSTLWEGLTEEKNQTTVYDIDIFMYKAGEAVSEYEISGTMNNK